MLAHYCLHSSSSASYQSKAHPAAAPAAAATAAAATASCMSLPTYVTTGLLGYLLLITLY